jgi:hypothetical protein
MAGAMSIAGFGGMAGATIAGAGGMAGIAGSQSIAGGGQGAAAGVILPKQTVSVPRVGRETGFGHALALTEDTLVIGWYGEDRLGWGTGAAHVLIREGDTWVAQSTLVAADGAAGDQFGAAVALEGDTVVVGAPQSDEVGPNAGAAYVFVRSGTSWSLEAKLQPPTQGEAVTGFGSDVSLSGSTVVIGTQRGTAYVFVRNGTEWTPHGMLTPTGLITPSSPYFDNIAIDGDTVAYAGYEEVAGRFQHTVCVFMRTGMSFIEVARIPVDTGGMGMNPLALQDDTIVTIALDPETTWNTSVARLTRLGASWSAASSFVRPGASYFGTALALSATRLAITDQTLTEEFPYSPGFVHLFERAVNGWEHISMLAPTDRRTSDERLGQLSAVAVSETAVAVGARSTTLGPGGMDGGYVFIY